MNLAYPAWQPNRLRAVLVPVLAFLMAVSPVASARASDHPSVRPSPPVAAYAPPRNTREYHVDPGLILQHIRGPITVVVVGNPFRYAWSVTVNNSVVTAPGPDKALLLQTPTGSTPAPAASAPPAPASPQPTAQPGQIVVSLVPNPSGASTASGTCDSLTTFGGLEKCVRDLAAQVDFTTKHDVVTAYQTVCTAQLEYIALQRRADDVIDELHYASAADRVSARAELANLLGGKPGDQPATPSCGGPGRFDAPRPGLQRYRYATVASATAAIQRIVPYPADALQHEQSALDELKGALKAYDPSRVQSDLKIDASKIQTKNILNCENTAHPKQKKLTALPDKLTPKCNPLLDAGKDIKDKIDTEITKTTAPAKQHLDTVTGELTTIGATLATYAPTAPWPTLLTGSVKQLQSLQSTVLANVGVSRFYVEIPEECNGLYGNGRTTTITVQRYANEANSVVVDCPSRVFSTAGFAFGFQPQRTFTAAGTNQAFPQAPPGSPTPPPATIQEGSVSDVRPVPVVLLNVRFQPAEGPIDNDFYLSFGVSVNSGPQTTTLDYLAGLSYSLSRQLLVTGGMQLGPENSLLGAKIGDPIPLGTSPQTVTRNRLRPFIAITYGPH